MLDKKYKSQIEKKPKLHNVLFWIKIKLYLKNLNSVNVNKTELRAEWTHTYNFDITSFKEYKVMSIKW